MSTGYISRRAKIKDEVNVFEPVISTTEGGYITDIHAGENITIRGSHEAPTISAKDTTYTAGENITISSDNVISASGGGASAVQPLDATDTGDLIFTQMSGTSDKNGVVGTLASTGANEGEPTIAIRKSSGSLEVGAPVALADAVNLEKHNTDLALKQDKLIAGDNITIVDNVISATGGGGGVSTGCRLVPNVGTNTRNQWGHGQNIEASYEWYTLPDTDDLLLVYEYDDYVPIGTTGNWTLSGDYYNFSANNKVVGLSKPFVFNPVTTESQYYMPTGYTNVQGVSPGSTQPLCKGYLLPALEFKLVDVGVNFPQGYDCPTYTPLPTNIRVLRSYAGPTANEDLVFSSNTNLYNNNVTLSSIYGDKLAVFKPTYDTTTNPKYVPCAHFRIKLYVHVFAQKTN